MSHVSHWLRCPGDEASQTLWMEVSREWAKATTRCTGSTSREVHPGGEWAWLGTAWQRKAGGEAAKVWQHWTSRAVRPRYECALASSLHPLPSLPQATKTSARYVSVSPSSLEPPLPVTRPMWSLR